MTTTHDEFLERAALAVFEPIAGPEAAELKAHLAGCPACAEAAQGFKTAAAALPWSLPPADLPAGLKAKVFERLLAETQAGTGAGSGRLAAAPPAGGPGGPSGAPSGPAPGGLPGAPPRLTLVHGASTEPPRRERAEPATWRVAAVALGTGMVASLALNVYFWGHLGSATGQLALLKGDKAAMEQKLAGMQVQAEERIAQLAVLQASDARMAKIPGQPMAKDASAMLFWSAREQAWLVAASGMPQASADKTYQLWAVTVQGQKISMGTFRVDPQGSAVVRVNLPKGGMKPAAAAVSLEPAGGMPQPTGPIVMMGELKI